MLLTQFGDEGQAASLAGADLASDAGVAATDGPISGVDPHPALMSTPNKMTHLVKVLIIES